MFLNIYLIKQNLIKKNLVTVMTRGGGLSRSQPLAALRGGTSSYKGRECTKDADIRIQLPL